MSRSARVFISYSHDSQAHKERVLDLADRLRLNGIDAEIDQYEVSPPAGWPAWCERQIDGADFVLMVCTDTYHRRVRGEEAPGTGLGVVWEARIIRQCLYDAGVVSEKFIPVLFSDGSSDDVPVPIRGWTRYNVNSEQEYENLYRRLTDQPWVTKPPLGSARPLPARPSRSRGGEILREAVSAVPKTQRDVQWSNWAKLLNREPQETALIERLESMRRGGRDFEPLLVILPGCSFDCHEYFIDRISWHDLRSFTADEKPFVVELPWRLTADPYFLLNELPQRLPNLKPTSNDLHSIMKSLARLTGSFCFFHRIDEDAWRADGGKLLREWVDYFCAAWPKPPPGHLVIGFLCIELPERRTGPMSLLRALIPRLSGSLASFVEDLRLRAEPRLLVTPALETIRRKHLMSWVRRIREYVADTERAEDIWVACKDLLPDPSAQHSFEDIYPELRHILQEIMGRGVPVVTQ